MDRPSYPDDDGAFMARVVVAGWALLCGLGLLGWLP